MIKLVVSDIDGTLVKDGSHDINPEMFTLIKKLKNKGILFAAASGRQYPSICRLFEPVKEDVIFIAENGAYVVCRDTELSHTPMRREMVEDIVKQMRQIPDCILTASGKHATYIENEDKEFLDWLVNGYRNNVECVEDVLQVDAEIVKLALYGRHGIEEAIAQLVPVWKDKVKVVVSGTMWLDFMDASVDKGNALDRIQQITGIQKEETICFGDNSNDIGMFHRAGKSYAVATANPLLQKEATEIIGTYEQDSVMKQLEKLLLQEV